MPGADTQHRRLAAIMFTDMVGYNSPRHRKPITEEQENERG
jgi:hypothetical protein